ncbi:MAG: glycosyltransferase [Patescibacteria group bacterium]
MERFLLPTPDYPPKRGGVARYCSALVSTFSEVIVPLIWKSFPSYREMIAEFWSRRKDFDVLLTSHVLPIGTAAFAFRLISGKPYDVILHGLDFDAARSIPRKRFAMKVVLFFARRIFANSQSLADEISVFAHRPCLVMYPCVTDEFVEAADVLVRASSPESIRLLTVGRLVSRKGHLKVLEAMKSIPNSTYTIVGDGPMKKEILDTIKTFDLESRVTILQHVSDGKLPEVYATHDVFLMPSTKSTNDREGFGIVALEAALFGLPVIATNQPGVDEAVIQGRTGLLIDDTIADLAKAIIELAADEPLRHRLGRNGRERVIGEFTREKTMRNFAQCAQGVIADRSRAALAQDLSLVSVVIPTYQHANTIGRCIESVLGQTYSPIEIIIVDDGSTDNTAEVLRKFDRKIRVIHQENAGANPARNRGLAEATGEFVIFCDADVVMKPEMIAHFVHQLQSRPEASYAYSGFRFGWKVFHGVPFSGDALRRMNFVHTTSLVRRKDFPGFDPVIRRFQDWDVWLTMLERQQIGVLVPGVWCNVLIDGESRIGSSWLPSFMYRLPWKYVGWEPARVRKYREAREAIVKKHRL